MKKSVVMCLIGYCVLLVWSCGGGGSSKDTVTNNDSTSNSSPIAVISEPIINGLHVSLDGTDSTDPDGDAITFTWQFGDGSSDFGDSVNHTYTTAGTYIIQLIVNDGTVDSAAGTVSIMASTGGSTTYWVSKTGSDNNDCLSESQSCLSIQKVLNMIDQGQTLNIKEGTYIEDPNIGPNQPGSTCSMMDSNFGSICMQSSGTATEPIIIQAAPGHEGKVIIDGEGVRGGILIGSHDYIHVKYLNFHNSNYAGIRSWGQPQNTVANYVSSSVGCLIEGNTIINTTGPSGTNVSAIGPWGSQDWIIKNNYIRGVSREGDGAASAIQAYGVINALVENNEFYETQTGIFWKDHFVLDEITRDPVVESEIRNNIFGTEGKGVYLGIRGTDSPEAGYNYIHHNIFYNHRNSEHGAISFEMAGAYDQSKNLRIEHNTIDGNGVASVGISGDSYSNISSKGNIIVGNTNSYIFTKYSSNLKQVDLVYSDYNIFDDVFNVHVDRYSSGNAFTHTSLPSWQQAVATDHYSLDYDNPDQQSVTSSRLVLFNDPDNRDYSYASGSKALGFMDDGSNAGAYQYGSEVIGLLPSHPLQDSGSGGGLYTITGSGFGTKAGTSYFDDMEGAQPGQVNGPIGNLHTSWNVGTTITDSDSVIGTKSFKQDFSVNDFPKVYIPLSGTTDKVYFSCYLKISGTVDSIAVWKMGRVGVGTVYSGNPKAIASYTSNGGSPLPQSVGGEMTTGDGTLTTWWLHNTALADPGLTFVQDEWMFYEVEFYAGTLDNSDSFFIERVNGVETIKWENRPFLITGYESLPTWFLTPINGIDGFPHINYLMDAVYQDESLARVLMTDNAVYTSSTKFAVQPIVSMSDSIIVTDKKRQVFNIGEIAYLHVFNENGELIHSGSSFVVTEDNI